MIALWNDVARAWAEIFVPAVLQNTAFLAILLLVLHHARGLSARARYVVASVGLIKLLVPPFLVAPATERAVHSWSAAGGAIGIIPFSPAPEVAAAAGAAAAPSLSVAGILLAVWVVGVSLAIGVPLVSAIRLVIRLRHAEPVAADTLSEVALPLRVRVLRSDRIAAPLTIALIPRAIFVPVAWDRWSAECRRLVLRHEAAHLQRADGPARILQALAGALYFFHPLVLLLNRRLNDAREMACDDAAVEGGATGRLRFSRQLVEIAESIARDAFAYRSANALFRRRSELTERVRYQMDPERTRVMSKMRVGALMAGVILIAASLSWRIGEAESAKRGTERHPETATTTHTSDQRASLEVDVTGEVRVDGEPVAAEELSMRLSARTENGAEGTIVELECAGAVPMSAVHEIHRTLVSNDLNRVLYRMAGKDGLPLVLPSDRLVEKLAEMPAELVVTVRVNAAGETFVNGDRVADDAIVGAIATRLEADDRIVVSLVTEGDTRYDDFVRVLGRLVESGATRIAISDPVSGE